MLGESPRNYYVPSRTYSVGTLAFRTSLEIIGRSIVSSSCHSVNVFCGRPWRYAPMFALAPRPDYAYMLTVESDSSGDTSIANWRRLVKLLQHLVHLLSRIFVSNEACVTSPGRCRSRVHEQYACRLVIGDVLGCVRPCWDFEGMNVSAVTAADVAKDDASVTTLFPNIHSTRAGAKSLSKIAMYIVYYAFYFVVYCIT